LPPCRLGNGIRAWDDPAAGLDLARENRPPWAMFAAGRRSPELIPAMTHHPKQARPTGKGEEPVRSYSRWTRTR